MRIDGNQSIQPYLQKRQTATADNKPSGTKNTQDEVNISQEAKELLQRRTMRDVTSPERSERINQLKEAIQNGTYQVDSEQTAHKMLQYWKWR